MLNFRGERVILQGTRAYTTFLYKANSWHLVSRCANPLRLFATSQRSSTRSLASYLQEEHRTSTRLQSPTPVTSSGKQHVILIGWLGAQPRHFNKYVKLWQKMGHSTYAIRPRTSSILCPPLGDLEARSFLQQVQERQITRPDEKILIHVFSNAGFIFFGTVLRLLRLEPKGKGFTSLWTSQVAGIAIDSAPARLTPDIAARGFSAAMLRLPATDIAERYPKLFAAVRKFFLPVLQNSYIHGRSNEVWEAWQSHAPHCPQLYLFSYADALIPPDEVQSFMACQGKRGLITQMKMWEDSPHCEHYRCHPTEYRKQLEDFAATTK